MFHLQEKVKVFSLESICELDFEGSFYVRVFEGDGGDVGVELYLQHFSIPGLHSQSFPTEVDESAPVIKEKYVSMFEGCRDNAHDLCFLCNHPKLVMCSPAAERLFGRSNTPLFL